MVLSVVKNGLEGVAFHMEPTHTTFDVVPHSELAHQHLKDVSLDVVGWQKAADLRQDSHVAEREKHIDLSESVGLLLNDAHLLVCFPVPIQPI